MDELVARITKAWLVKASHDLQAAELLASNGDKVLDAAIYHCQQCAEKALKGFLAAQNEPIQKTHDLRLLVTMGSAFDATLPTFRTDAEMLNPMGVKYRYPDPSLPDPEREEFTEALAAARRIYDFVLSVLPPETHPA
ncbi:MAG: HEPN domain-containing protein [Prosthecobacter sp.]|nr:HEPN domain-containing protein [Prosthecobacter sp.]